MLFHHFKTNLKLLNDKFEFKIYNITLKTKNICSIIPLVSSYGWLKVEKIGLRLFAHIMVGIYTRIPVQDKNTKSEKREHKVAKL